MTLRATLCIAWLAALLIGCSAENHVQSTLDAHGDDAGRIAALGVLMFAGAAVILGAVTLLTGYAVLRAPERRSRLGGRNLVVLGGIVFPVLVLSVLLVYGLSLTGSFAARGASDVTLRVEVVAEQWWWRVRYVDAAGDTDFTTANEIRIPVGEPVEFVLKTADVIHSFWVPSLAGKLDMIPGHVNRLRVRAHRTGLYRGQCAEYCGGAHAAMAFYVVVEESQAFEGWRVKQRQPGHAPENDMIQRGQALFINNGCGACHTIRGTPAQGIVGPDLTHVGGRQTIGAGMFPNNAGTLAAWIVEAPHLKPENKMPPFGIFTRDELTALAGYLESLR